MSSVLHVSRASATNLRWSRWMPNAINTVYLELYLYFLDSNAKCHGRVWTQICAKSWSAYPFQNLWHSRVVDFSTVLLCKNDHVKRKRNLTTVGKNLMWRGFHWIFPLPLRFFSFTDLVYTMIFHLKCKKKERWGTENAVHARPIVCNLTVGAVYTTMV